MLFFFLTWTFLSEESHVLCAALWPLPGGRSGPSALWAQRSQRSLRALVRLGRAPHALPRGGRGAEGSGAPTLGRGAACTMMSVWAPLSRVCCSFAKRKAHLVVTGTATWPRQDPNDALPPGGPGGPVGEGQPGAGLGAHDPEEVPCAAHVGEPVALTRRPGPAPGWFPSRALRNTCSFVLKTATEPFSTPS